MPSIGEGADFKKQIMISRIIEIVEIGQPKSIIQRENEPISELIDTDSLVKELNQELSLFAVSRESEQCEHTVDDLIRLNSSGFKCKCGKEVTYF